MNTEQVLKSFSIFVLDLLLLFLLLIRFCVAVAFRVFPMQVSKYSTDLPLSDVLKKNLNFNMTMERL